MAEQLTVFPVPGAGTEDVVVDPSGLVYTGTEDGAIFRLRPDGSRVDRVGHTGGRPLGLELLPDGRLLVCDAQHGLLALDPADGGIEPLLDTVSGTRMVFCNNAAVAANGDIWFSDSSKVYGLADWKKDFVENTRTGRLLRRTVSGEVEVLLAGLAFANGVALAEDESWVAVAETGARSVVRLWLSGDRAGTQDFLAQDLPGYPDNISRGSDGLVWVTISSPKDPLVERLMRAPMALRRISTRMPERLQPQVKRTVRVQAYDAAGGLVHDLERAAEDYHMVTGVREFDGQVWLGSLHEPAVAVTDVRRGRAGD